MGTGSSGYCKCGQANSATNPGMVVFHATFAPEEISGTAKLVAYGSAKCASAPKPAMIDVQISQNGSPWQSIGFLSEFGTGRVALKPIRSTIPLLANTACEVQFLLGADTETADDKDFFGATILELDA